MNSVYISESAKVCGEELDTGIVMVEEDGLIEILPVGAMAMTSVVLSSSDVTSIVRLMAREFSEKEVDEIGAYLGLVADVKTDEVYQ